MVYLQSLLFSIVKEVTDIPKNDTVPHASDTLASKPLEPLEAFANIKLLKTNSLEKDKIYIRSEDSNGDINIKGIPRPRSNSGSRFLTDKVGFSHNINKHNIVLDLNL